MYHGGPQGQKVQMSGTLWGTTSWQEIITFALPFVTQHHDIPLPINFQQHMVIPFIFM
jgi:hypothetical protein